MNGRLWSSVVALGVLAACRACAGEVTFTVQPKVTRQGDAIRIAFACSANTDVEVAVLDATNGVVRHLAAGLLGGTNAPPEPLRPGLEQSLSWDGKDDFGRPAANAPFRVRVRAGLGVRFARFIGDDPYTFGSIGAVGADEDGALYVMGFGANRNQGFRTIRKFDAAGKYLRTVMPFPADLAPDSMKDVAAWDDARKVFHPQNLNSLNPEFYAGGLTFVTISRKNGMVLTDGTRLYTLETSGAVRGSRFTTATLWDKALMPWGNLPNVGGGPVCMAVSPDGQYIFVAGPFSSKDQYGHAYDKRIPPGAIYRAGLGTGETLQLFASIEVDHQDGTGGAWRKYNAYYNGGVPEGPVHGLAVDAKGNLLAADRQNQRVVMFDPAGKEIAESKVSCPHQIAVHPASGAIYVLTRHQAAYGTYKVGLVRLKDLQKDATPAATYAFPAQRGGSPQMAVVASDKQTIIYVVGVNGGMVALEDKGAEFAPVEMAFKPAAEALDVFNRMEVDPVREELYLSDGGTMYARFNGLTGEGGLLKKGNQPFIASDLAVGYDGMLYLQGCQQGADFSGPLERYTRDLEPAPFPGGTHVLSKYIYGRYGIGNCEKGIGVGPDGKVYVAWMFGGWVKYAVTAWGPDGKAINGKYSEIFKGHPDKKDPAKFTGGHHSAGTSPELTQAVVGPIPQCNGGVRVDLQGNIYVGMIADPKSMPPFPGFEKNDSFKHCTGSIVKFGPEGGKIEGGEEMMTGGKIEGVRKVYPGLAPFSHPSLGTSCCVCRVPRFGVDRYGRLAVPNATGNFVLLLDNAGNTILEVGGYGNFDSQLVNANTADGRNGKPTVAIPAIPLAWPNCASLTDKSLYILDIYSRRAVRAELTWKAEAIAGL